MNYTARLVVLISCNSVGLSVIPPLPISSSRLPLSPQLLYQFHGGKKGAFPEGLSLAVWLLHMEIMCTRKSRHFFLCCFIWVRMTFRKVFGFFCVLSSIFMFASVVLSFLSSSWLMTKQWFSVWFQTVVHCCTLYYRISKFIGTGLVNTRPVYSWGSTKKYIPGYNV